MMLQPILPLPLLLPIALVVLGVVGWLCVVACRRLSRWWCGVCVTLALLAALCGLALLLNPGHVEQRPSAHAPIWVVGNDVSASMAAPVLDDPQAVSRSAVAARVVQRLAEYPQRDVRWLALADGPLAVASAEDLAAQPAAGRASAIMSSMAAGIETLRRSGRTVAGAVLISDGRDTRPQALQQLVSCAGAAGCPVHVVPLGSTWQAPDFAVSTSHPFVMAYPGVETQLTARVRNTRMGSRQLQVQLLDAAGTTLQQQTLNVAEGEEQTVTFTSKAQAGEYRICVSPQQGESRVDNNETRITVRAVNSRIRVFLAEGAPYWDSKFLAQYLREQPVFDVRSVHRLSEKRFYHINTGDDDAVPTEAPGMPTTAEKLAGYDIVVLGKGMERLMDAAAVKALHSWVMEQGGILVLSRGRCYGGRLDGMEALEPFVWGNNTDAAEHRLAPAQEGLSSGLFGSVLPGAEEDVWGSLPALDDVWAVQETRPQTRVLAVTEGGNTPMLGMMRLGLGAVACVNGEGLWKWDFFPEARQHGNMYREFWRRFLPWVQTAAEFMPGFDLSLHADRADVQEGEGFTCLLGWRGVGRPSAVTVQAVNLATGAVVAEQVAVLRPSAAMPRWECAFAPLPPGEYLLRAVAADTPAPECRLRVRPLPAEDDNLNADAELLARVAESTGGQVLPAELSAEQLESVFAMPAGVQATEDVYCPLWAEWQVLAAMVGCLGLLWYIRRRKGLA
ncbi:MAG: hypothetical protein II295_03440 [Akkermansia sp.]|nr:hypothetical protein [Akkermansia sp.]